MPPFVLRPNSNPGLTGKIYLPGDKSIAHRALILSAIAPSDTRIRNFPFNKDCLATVNSLKKLGIKIKLISGKRVIVYGKGLCGLTCPKSPISIEESGTTFRLLLGILAGQKFRVKLSAGKFLSGRPMLRVIQPLRMMGAAISARKIKASGKPEEYPPVTITGNYLKGITYKTPVASAQVKGAILLAGLFAQGETKVIEPLKTRGHTERMLKLFKANLKVNGKAVTVKGLKELVSPGEIYIPGDISSAAFFMVGASIISGSEVLIKNLGLNPGRAGIIKVLKRMGAKIKIRERKY